jgi:BMFP domain-containing protein YqiC
MFDSKSIDDIANRLANAIPPSFNHLKEDMEKNFHAILQSALARLDLVTREEFEIQKAVLAKTRQKLEVLEQRVAEIEKQILTKEEMEPVSKAKSAKHKAKGE